MAVIRSVRYLLLTKNFERPFQSNIGSRIQSLLFEPIDALTAQSLKSEIENVLDKFEPRVSLVQVTIYEKPDDNAYSVTIQFYIGNNVEPTAINLILERTR
jgi:phage baseplate assembly protein W